MIARDLQKYVSAIYSQNIYVKNYYFDAVLPSTPQQLRRPYVQNTYRRHIPVPDERAHYYSAAPETFRNSAVYSSPQIATIRRPTTHTSTLTPANRPVVRRHPVTVRTPRYYRRTSNLYKKPSALCLPLSCQPDPAFYRRGKKALEDSPCSLKLDEFVEDSFNQPLERRHSVPATTNIGEASAQMQDTSMEYSSNLQMSRSDVDAVLARYESVLGDNITLEATPQKASRSSSKSSVAPKLSVTNLATHLTPKVPPSIKEKQQQKKNGNFRNSKLKTKTNSSNNVDRLEVEEITTEVLDSMLSELLENGYENKIKDNQERQSSASSRKSEYKENKPSSNTPKEDQGSFSKSFNYQEISEKMAQSSQHLGINLPVNNQIHSPVQSPRFEPTNPSVNNTVTQNNHLENNNNKTVDACNAIELHRSKSYIVSLIDRALSKELGTAPEVKSRLQTSTQPRHSSQLREGDQIDAKLAIDMMNKNLDKMDKGLCLEITQALTDSIVSNATAPHTVDPKHGSACSCNVQDEPLYVKQLKQLRWGHLRHIQREVRRLEDLERFLDSCSSGSFM